MQAQGPQIAQRRPIGMMTWLVAAFVGVIVLLVSLWVLTIIGLRSSGVELRRAEQSLTQLENARAIDATFTKYLLEEIRRRIQGDLGRDESAAAAEVRQALLAYRQKIGEEVSTAGDEGARNAERSEMIRASALADLFETIETEAMFDRLALDGSHDAESALSFLSDVAAGRDEVFQSVLLEVMADERAEAEAAFAAITDLRGGMIAIGTALSVAFVIALGLFGLLFYRGMMRPIRRLARAAEGFGSAHEEIRAPDDLPGEFAMLAERFNAMAARIETEQHRLQDEVAARTSDLAEANEALRRVDRTRRAFFANVSHELRTPVTVLLGEAQIALRTPGDERATLERIAANGGFLRRRLDDLLQLARSEDGALKLLAEPVDLNASVAEAVSSVESFATAHENKIVFESGPALTVTGDHAALRQAVLALIDNAIKFSPPGAEVRVRTTGTGVLVEDDGPGFGGVDPETLFDRYAQAGEGRNQGGAGLGLAIVKWIADQHGAVLRAEEGSEGGARITLEFPG